jgi:hypothetical protein
MAEWLVSVPREGMFRARPSHRVTALTHGPNGLN